MSAAAEDAARLTEEIDKHLAQVAESWALLKDVISGPPEEALDGLRRTNESLDAGKVAADSIRQEQP